MPGSASHGTLSCSTNVSIVSPAESTAVRISPIEWFHSAESGEATGVAVAVVTALMGWSYWALVAQQIAVQGVPVILAVTRIGWLPSGPHKARLGEVRGALSFGGYIAGQGIMNRLMTYTGIVIAGSQLSTTAAGLSAVPLDAAAAQTCQIPAPRLPGIERMLLLPVIR